MFKKPLDLHYMILYVYGKLFTEFVSLAANFPWITHNQDNPLIPIGCIPYVGYISIKIPLHPIDIPLTFQWTCPINYIHSISTIFPLYMFINILIISTLYILYSQYIPISAIQFIWSDLWNSQNFMLEASINQFDIPSGKRLHNYGKSPFFMGQFTTLMVIFHSDVKLPEGISTIP